VLGIVLVEQEEKMKVLIDLVEGLLQQAAVIGGLISRAM
jgi:hypothetical protein